MSIKRSIIFLTLLISSNLLQAQVLNVSPYSTYGIGDLNSRAFMAGRAMGNAQTALFEFDVINGKNPAGNAFVTKPLFDLGFTGTNIRLDGPAGSTSSAFNKINHFALAFPFAKRFAISALLSPHTTLGFELVEEEELSEAGTVQSIYNGFGGLNRMNGGFSMKIINDSLNILSLGAHLNYYFGFFDRTTELRFLDEPDFLNSITGEDATANGFSGEFGLAYSRRLGKELQLTLGAGFEPGRKLKLNQVASTFIFVGPEFTGDPSTVVDTLEAVRDTSELFLPMHYNVGASLKISNKLLISLEYDFWEWSKLNLFGTNPGLVNSYSIGAGLQFWPDYRAVNDLLRATRYRAGFRYGQSRILIDNQNLNEFGINFGLGIPLLKSGSFSTLNVGLEYGQRGSQNVNTFSESFTSINIGVSLMPNRFDRWFYKRRIE